MPDPVEAEGGYHVHNEGSLVMLQLDRDDFYQCIQVISQKDYEDQQIESLKHIFATDDAEYVEKLKLMKLEQDAQAKQRSMSTRATKKPKLENMGVNIVSNDAREYEQSLVEVHEQHMMEMINPFYKVQQETRERLTRYGILDYANTRNDFYSLKFVKIDPEEVDGNPIFKKAREYQQRKLDTSQTEADLLEDEILQEMKDTIQINL